MGEGGSGGVGKRRGGGKENRIPTATRGFLVRYGELDF